jgi:hypothetical protein
MSIRQLAIPTYTNDVVVITYNMYIPCQPSQSVTQQRSYQYDNTLDGKEATSMTKRKTAPKKILLRVVCVALDAFAGGWYLNHSYVVA